MVMKRVLYNTCAIDPWINVAKKLKNQNGWEPVYWVEYTFDNAYYYAKKDPYVAVKAEFPNVVYHNNIDAWHGVFPEEVEKNYCNYYPDVDTVLANTMHEVEPLTMMNRLDYDRYSFNFMEREFHYYNLFKHWLCVLDKFKPDIVISGNNPHRVYDYVLYIICKQRNIPFIMFQYYIVPGRIFATNDIYSMNGKFRKDVDEILSKGKVSYDEIAEDIRESYENTKKSYADGQLWYMTQNLKDDKKGANWFHLAYNYFHRTAKQHGEKVRRSAQTIYKNKKYTLENTHYFLPEFAKMRLEAFSYNKKLRKLYESLSENPVPGEKYILFPLHYQPEETTSPCGGFFVNQWLCIETLLANTPNDWYVYVKEHPHQYLSHFQGCTSRIPDLYRNLKKNPRIRLMPFNMDSKVLIKDAIAVSTITGTVGWEALVMEKPVVIFGTIWFEDCIGTLKVKDSKTAHQIYEHIAKFHYSEENIIAFLQSISKNTIKAYHYMGYKELSHLDEESSAVNIVKEINRLVSNE